MYGLGLMRAEYKCLRSSVIEGVTLHFKRLCVVMSQQELCSFLHGLGKMTAEWPMLSSELRDTILESILVKQRLGRLCLACTVYSLGQMGAVWGELPDAIRSIVVASIESECLTEQTLANFIYGLNSMKAQWSVMEPRLTDSVIAHLKRPDAFRLPIAQHVSNTVWSLGKMDAAWHQLPVSQLSVAMERAAPFACAQEVVNMIYGIAVLDASWNEGPQSLRITLLRGMLRLIDDLTMQELANAMYALSMLTFDFSAKLDGGTAKEVKEEEQLLWDVHCTMITELKKRLDREDEIHSDNHDQFAIYVQTLLTVSGGKKMLEKVFGCLPRLSGPGATVPSRLHSNTVSATIGELWTHSPDYSVTHEYCGMDAVFPLDAAVHLGEELVAFIEIDGGD